MAAPADTSMTTLHRLCAALLCSLAGAGAGAHEFWMLPDRFTVAPGSAVGVSLHVGENFSGETVGLSRPLFASFRRYSAAGPANLAPSVPQQPAASIAVTLPAAGTHLLAIDTQPSEIVLEAAKFNAYLIEEGLETVAATRQASGTADAPGRERYRRNIKTLVQAGERRDTTYAVRTGQRLEIVPTTDPSRPAADGDVSFRVFFDGRPLSGTLVKLWHRRDGQLHTIRAKTDAKGKVTASLPWPGAWMASTVHMIAATGTRDHDWDSYWGNLTFEVPPGAAPAR